MKIIIIVDANVIISALLGGKPRFILFEPKFKFITTSFTLKEAQKYIPLISKKSGISEKEIKDGLNLLPIEIVPLSYYQGYIKEAERVMANIDKKDIEILALYLKEKTYLWSEDKDFEKARKRSKINLLKTEDFL